MLKIPSNAHVAAIVVGVGLAMTATALNAQTVTKPIAGPITMYQMAGGNSFDHLPSGYIVEERFVSGIATSYTRPGNAPAGSAGVPAATAPYKTRIVVVRPSDPAKFNGTVVVEWLNVSGSTDGAGDWSMMHRELTRGGYVYVGVSAQKAGLDGGGFFSIPDGPPVKKTNPQRYGSLEHPGDAFAYDIYSQTAKLVRNTSADHILGPLKVKDVIATGVSQSAAFLITYVNAVDPVAKAFDGFLIHSRGRGAAPLDGDQRSAAQALAGPMFDPVLIRSDVRVPVLQFIVETDLTIAGRGYVGARQPDASKIRTWELAGAAHFDSYNLSGGAVDTGTASPEELAKVFTPVASLIGQPLQKPMNTSPQHHYVMEAGLSALTHWIETGRAPAEAPRLQVTEANPPEQARDGFGNALGGIRSPWMDVPTRTLSGFGQALGGAGGLVGSTELFDRARLAQLYPGGRREYMTKFASALQRAIDNGFILIGDKAEILALAEQMYPSDQ